MVKLKKKKMMRRKGRVEVAETYSISIGFLLTLFKGNPKQIEYV